MEIKKVEIDGEEVEYVLKLDKEYYEKKDNYSDLNLEDTKELLIIKGDNNDN